MWYNEAVTCEMIETKQPYFSYFKINMLRNYSGARKYISHWAEHYTSVSTQGWWPRWKDPP